MPIIPYDRPPGGNYSTMPSFTAPVRQGASVVGFPRLGLPGQSSGFQQQLMRLVSMPTRAPGVPMPSIPPGPSFSASMAPAAQNLRAMTMTTQRAGSSAPLGGIGAMSLPAARMAQMLGPYGRPAAMGAVGLGALGTALGLMDSERPAAPMPTYFDANGNTVNAAGVPQIPVADPGMMVDPLAGDPEAQAQAANARISEVLGLLAPTASAPAQAPAPAKPPAARAPQRSAPTQRPQAAPALAPTWAQRGFVQQPDGTWMKVEQIPAVNQLLFGDDQ